VSHRRVARSVASRRRPGAAAARSEL